MDATAEWRDASVHVCHGVDCAIEMASHGASRADRRRRSSERGRTTET